MSVGVIEVQCQAVDTFTQRKRKSMIVRVPNRAPGRQGTVLRVHEQGRSAEIAQNNVSQRLSIRPVVAGKEGLPRIVRWHPDSAVHGIERLRIGPGWIPLNLVGIVWVRQSELSIERLGQTGRE